MGLALFPSNDLLQGRNMPGKRPSAGRGRRHRRLWLLAHKRLLHGDIAGLRQRLDMGAEIAVSGAGELLQAREFEARCRRQRIQRWELR